MSRQYFNFAPLIADFANDVEVISVGERQLDSSGKWVTTEGKRQNIRGAVIGFRESKIYRSGGTITSKDKHFFTHQPIPDALIGANAVFRGQRYTIEAETENAEFTGVYSYVLRWVSAFDKK